MTRPADFRAGRGANRMTNLRPGAAYEFTVADQKYRAIEPGNFPVAFTILSNRDVLVGYTADGVQGSERFRVVAETVFRREVSTPALYVFNDSGDTATVNVDFELSQVAVPSGFGEFTAANGFDGGDSSAAVGDEVTP